MDGQSDLKHENASDGLLKTAGDLESGQPHRSDSSQNTLTAPATQEEERSPRSWVTKVREHLQGEVDPDRCTLQLSFFCLITGWVDAISFAAAFLFCGFQTGNTVQLAAAVARLFSGPDRGSRFELADQLALTSLVAFVLGAGIGQLGDRIGPKKRLWLIGCTLLQSGLMMGSFVAVIARQEDSYVYGRGEPAWQGFAGFAALALASAQMGMQGIVAKRLNTHYGTTVVLTTIWVELIADPSLLRWTRRVPSCDQKLVAIFMLFVGALVGRILVGTLGGGPAFGIGAGLKALVAISFWFVPSKVAKRA